MYTYKPTLLFLFANLASALRTCVDIQDTLIACVVSSDVDPVVRTGPEDIAKLCWHVDVMLECVAEARESCPNLPILADDSFSSAIRDMEQQRHIHCRTTETAPVPMTMTTSTSMPNDQPASCDPLAAMTRCNDVMAGVTPGDVKAMCIPGEAYLQCLTTIVQTCPEHSSVLPFDLQEAIITTRYILEQECSAVLTEQECRTKIEDAKRGCADYLSDGTGDYCRSMEIYMSCLHNTLSSCPDPELQENIDNQYRLHCENEISSKKCPDDVQAAMMECNTIVMEAPPAGKDAYCRSTKEYVTCMDELVARCENTPRFSVIPLPHIEDLRQHINLMCSPGSSDNLITTRP